ncbi:ABC transporter permease [Rhodococcus spelaei]|uniref:ABC transporter permease n=1 Tax=Rhodococcus spelaei TaxID=2546320 RepID=A0A541BSK6_9NOCA|nr:ABC transporter permease [Rhodococcus spelaei]TQF75265.1 ABC transporter permease [Rhodococcus spelaei]
MVAVVLGVLLLQLGFITSYVAAFHQPTPRDIPIGVIADAGLPAGVDQQVTDKLNAIDGRPLQARVLANTYEARNLIADREIMGAYLISPTGTDTLITASGAGTSAATALEAIFTKADAAQHRTFVVRDEVPVSVHDNRGLSGFYLAIGWVVGGYLLAASIGLMIGAPRTLREAGVHTAIMAGYAAASGFLGALITTHLLGTFTGHLLPLSLLGFGVVFATGIFTMGLRAAVGILAVPLAILIFVVLGNPSAGGAFGSNVLPTFWATIGRWITPGAGTEGVRSIVYFHGTGVLQPVATLTLYAVVGLALVLGFTARAARPTRPVAPQVPATATATATATA